MASPPSPRCGCTHHYHRPLPVPPPPALCTPRASQVGKLDSLRLATRSKLHKKRALSSIRWRIGLGEDQMELGVKLYALLQPAGKAKVGRSFGYTVHFGCTY